MTVVPVDASAATYVVPPSLLDRLRYKRRQLRTDYVVATVLARLRTRQDRQQLEQLRGGRPVVWVPVANPLVTIRIATYSAGELLRRAVDSALRQTYPSIEVLVVGDQCDNATAAVAESYGDRIRFVQLGHRGQYPGDRTDRWMVAGSTPMNVAVDLARGDWIAPCDDDDELTDDHVEKLLRLAVEEQAELVWGQAAMEMADGSWTVTRGPEMQYGQVSHGATLYASELRFMRHDLRAYQRLIPGDWELFSRMRDAGVRIGYLPEVTYLHYASRSA